MQLKKIGKKILNSTYQAFQDGLKGDLKGGFKRIKTRSEEIEKEQQLELERYERNAENWAKQTFGGNPKAKIIINKKTKEVTVQIDIGDK